MGLVMLGSKSAEAIEDMVGYAQETQHEKIQRGIISDFRIFFFKIIFFFQNDAKF